MPLGIVIKSPEDPDLKAENEVINGMLRRGCDAQARGDFAFAERAFQDAADRERNDYSLPRLRLVRLYDLMGRDRDALTQYRTLLRAEPECEKPEILARYGELCLEFGDRMEARAAYTLAVERCVYGGEGNINAPKIAPRNASFDAVRAAALLCWAMKVISYDEKAQKPLLEAAERIDPANWIVRFYRASTLSSYFDSRDEAQREADKALSLAPSTERARILRMMEVSGLELPQPTNRTIRQGG